MKRILMALAAGLILAAPVVLPSGFAPGLPMALPAAQAAEMKVGVVDVQRILSGSSLMKALEAAQQEVAEAEKRLAQEYDRLRKELAEKQGKISEEEFVKLKRQYEDKMNGMKKSEEERLIKKREEITRLKAQLEKDLEDAVKKVASAKGLDLVIHKQLVIFGGIDITKEVLDALPKR
ncbi:MAG: OmpH family outer membrane protein [Candidatus Sericytochromatia bacterium]